MQLVSVTNTNNTRVPTVLEESDAERHIYVRLDSAKKTKTREGFYKFFNVPVARSGYFDYAVEELLVDGVLDQGYKKGEILKAYRPKETFTDAVIQSINGMPITLGHPKTGIATPDNVKFEGSITGNAFLESSEDGEVNLIISEITLYSRSIISAYEKGMRELSIGFYYKKPVEWRTGDNFNFIEEIIKINHLALVPRGRAGFGYRLNNQLEVITNMEMNLEKISENFVQASASLESAIRLNAEVAKAQNDTARINKEREEKEAEDKKKEAEAKAKAKAAEEEAKAKGHGDKDPEGKGDKDCGDKGNKDEKGGRKHDVFMIPTSFMKEIVKAIPDNVVFGYTVKGKAFDGDSDIDVMELFRNESNARKLLPGRANMFPDKSAGGEGRTNSSQVTNMIAVGD